MKYLSALFSFSCLPCQAALLSSASNTDRLSFTDRPEPISLNTFKISAWGTKELIFWVKNRFEQEEAFKNAVINVLRSEKLEGPTFFSLPVHEFWKCFAGPSRQESQYAKLDTLQFLALYRARQELKQRGKAFPADFDPSHPADGSLWSYEAPSLERLSSADRPEPIYVDPAKALTWEMGELIFWIENHYEKNQELKNAAINVILFEQMDGCCFFCLSTDELERRFVGSPAQTNRHAKLSPDQFLDLCHAREDIKHRAGLGPADFDPSHPQPAQAPEECLCITANRNLSRHEESPATEHKASE